MAPHKPAKRAKERRRTPRVQAADLVAYYWTGSVPMPREVREIGLHGAFIVGPESFYPGTVVQLVLEDRAAGPITGAGGEPMCVYGKALRREASGFPVAFLFENGSERRRFRRFLEQVKREEPAAPVEALPVAANESDGQTAKANQGEPTAPAVNDGPHEGEPNGIQYDKAG
jgi:hypothetical protein